MRVSLKPTEIARASVPPAPFDSLKAYSSFRADSARPQDGLAYSTQAQAAVADCVT